DTREVHGARIGARMNPEEIHRLTEEYRDGTISAADARLFAEAIRRDPRVASAVQQALAFTGHLGQAVDGASGADFARSFAGRLQAERSGADFVSAFEKRSSVRLTGRRRIRPSRPSLFPFLIAAAFALAVVGLVIYTSKEPPARPLAQQLPPPPPPREEP